MLQNIYNYSREFNNKAVFTIGAGHKKAIVKRIKEYETKEGVREVLMTPDLLT